MANGNFTFVCPHCGQHLEAEPDMVGMEFDCPGCGKVLAVPMPASLLTPVICVVSKPKLAQISDAQQQNVSKPNMSCKIPKWVYGVAGIVLVVIGVSVVMILSAKRRVRIPISNATSALDVVKDSALNDVGFGVASLTDKERNAIGAVMQTMKMAEPDSPAVERLTRNMYEPESESALEILMAFSTSIVTDTLEDNDYWNDCPRDFQTIAKKTFTATGKAEIALVIKKYGKDEVLRTLRQYNVHENYRKYYHDAMSIPYSSIVKELKDSKKEFQAIVSKYSLSEASLESQYGVDESKKSESNEEVADHLFVEAMRYYEGDGVLKNISKAIQLMKEASDKGSANANAKMAMLYWFGVPDDGKSVKKAIEYAEKSGKRKTELAEMVLGNCYLYGGDGVEQDFAKAYSHFTRSAKRYNYSKLICGLMQYYGVGTREDKESAAETFFDCCKGMDSGQYTGEAALCLGYMYAEGFGVEKNSAEAKKWLKWGVKAADYYEESCKTYSDFIFSRGIKGKDTNNLGKYPPNMDLVSEGLWYYYKEIKFYGL